MMGARSGVVWGRDAERRAQETDRSARDEEKRTLRHETYPISSESFCDCASCTGGCIRESRALQGTLFKRGAGFSVLSVRR